VDVTGSCEGAAVLGRQPDMDLVPAPRACSLELYRAHRPDVV
jgi:hypothetical protein